MTAGSQGTVSTSVTAQAGGSCSTNHGRQSKSQHANQSTTVVQNSMQTPSIQSSCPSFNSSLAFQQVKQTQASLARLCRVHQHHQHQNHGAIGPSPSNQSSQAQQQAKSSSETAGQSQQQQQQQKPTTFVDCLIRRFKNCFDGDFCTVPMFVVGNLSPGSDGTHLILPPCVSLGGQSINRFSSPKNLRLMNSIRESCRSIEELDLGGNKLTDLIEVYKILQCTPNLRFLNLSENDLSRSSPVAMASQCLAAQVPSIVLGNISTSSGFTSYNGSQSSSSIGHINNQRNYLAPINQNQLTHSSSIGIRRHSSLGQSSLSSSTVRKTVLGDSPQPSITMRTRQSATRVVETRRLAAANALAQSKKTSSSIASKLAHSAVSGGTLSCQVSGSCRTLSNNVNDEPKNNLGKPSRGVVSQRIQPGSTSTMHLARSLSSLSSKDIRAANSSSGRLSTHRSCLRSMSSTRANSATVNRRSSFGSSPQSGNLGHDKLTSSLSQVPISKITTSTSHQKLYVEPIAESEDVEMSSNSEQQPPLNNQTPVSSSNSHIGSPNTSNSANTSSSNQQNYQQLSQSKTGIQTLRSYYNSNQTLSSTASNQSATYFRRTFETIKALALNNTGCQWKVVCSILSRMPNLEELHLSLNNYEKIDLDTNEFKHHSLKRLYLCNNPKLTHWKELDKLLIAFPSLEALSIADCNISQIPDNLGRAREWRKLCGLNINGWPIKEWPVVERLNQLPSLIDLRCRNLAVLSTIDEPRHHLIARLPNLLRLNGSEIEEREDAEKAFLRFFLVNSHLERPQRFHELMKVYGEIPHTDVDVDLSPPSQANVKLIYLNRNHYKKADEDDVLMSEDFLQKLMDNIEANSPGAHENMDVAENDTNSADLVGTNGGPVRLFKDEGQEVVALQIDLRQSVRKFKSIIASIFGLATQNLIIYYIDHEMVGLMGPELIKHNQKKLWNYNVQDGDQFIVEDR